GQRACTAVPSALDRRVPQDGQNAAPSNRAPKQAGQLIRASTDWQYRHRELSVSAEAPQLGQCSDSASIGRQDTSEADTLRCFNTWRRGSMGLMDFIKGELIDVIEWT